MDQKKKKTGGVEKQKLSCSEKGECKAKGKRKTELTRARPKGFPGVAGKKECVREKFKEGKHS